MTVLDLVSRALRLIGWLQPGEVPSNTVAQNVLISANSLISSLSLDRNQIYMIPFYQFAWPAGQISQTVGPGGNWNIPRPLKIENANLLYQTSPVVKIGLRVFNNQQYAELSIPTINSVPADLYFDNGFSSSAPAGVGTAYLYPVPNQPYTIELWTWLEIAQLSTVALNTVIHYPPGYDRMLAALIAREILPDFGRTMTPELEAMCNEATVLVTSHNAQSPIMHSDPALPGAGTGSGRFNYLDGSPY